MSALPFLTDSEVAEICSPLVRATAQCKYLANVLKLKVHAKPNGRPLIARSEFERVIGADRVVKIANDPQQAPNVTGMMAFLEGRKHGTKSQGR